MDRKRFRWWVGMAVVAFALCGATIALATWAHLPVRLSTLTAVCDVEPRASMSEDGGWLASVWIQGRQINDGCVSRGVAVLRWATTEQALTGWSNHAYLVVPWEYGSGCFVHTDVVVNGNTAHVVATIWSPCDRMDADSVIAYYVCELSTGNCSPATIVAEQWGSQELRFSEAKIVLDSQHRPHIVYGRGTHTLADGKLYYTRNLGTGWSAPLLISPSSESAYRPSLATSNDRIHIVWENHRDFLDSQGRWRQNGDVRYRYCAVEGSCGNITGYPSPTTLVEKTYPVPDITARDGRVMMTWNICADVNSNPPCEKFYLVYTRSNNNGTSFLPQPLEVGSETPMQSISISPNFYLGSDGDNNLAGEYASHLNARIALDPSGLPYLAWHIQEGSGYVITTSHAIAQTYSNFTWSQDDDLPQFGAGSDNRVYPSLELTTVDDTQALHIVYIRSWRDGIWGRSQVYYDVASPARPRLRLSYAERSNALPHERAQKITAYVEEDDGTGVAGVPVIFKTTLGSFTPVGYGVLQTQGTTDATGAVTVTLYSNQVGTAHVYAWADSVANMQWDVEEPGATLTQTWTYNGTPSLLALPGPVMGGHWITATVLDHPYSDLDDLEGSGWPLSYFLWWCPVDAPDEPPPQQVGDDFVVNVNTWDYAAMLQVPADVTGTYRLETHTDLAGDPCENPDTLVAASGEISATSEYPPDPIITVNGERPYPSEQMTATLRTHQDDTYDVWWCTDSGKVVTEVVAQNVAVSSDAEDIEFYVPSGVAGLYHLESHHNVAGAMCGNEITHAGSSSLIWPLSKIYLPLVMRGH